MKKTLLAFGMMLSVIGLTGCAEIEYNREQVTGTVVYKDYDSSWMQPVSAGKVTTFIHHPASYDITVNYEGVETTFDDKALFDSVEIGDTLIVNLVKKVEIETGKQRQSYLELIE